ncbi:WXG100 family type VII secretion target [Nocardia beijingensis]
MTNPRQYEQAYQGGLASTRLSLERFLKEDGSNVFDQPIWSQPRLTGPGVKELLDQAAPGLEWFRLALVRYHRVWDLMKLPGFDHIDVPPMTVDNTRVGGERIDTTRDPNDEMRRLEGKHYDQQRSMNLDSLRALATAITGTAAGTGTHRSADDITRDLGGVATAVPEVWQGEAGSAAQEYLAGFHAHADQQAQYLQAVSAALNGLPDVLLQIVKDKASFIAGFDSPQCPVAGHAMRIDGAEDPVSPIITVAAGDRDWLGNDAMTAIQQLHLSFLNTKDNFPKIQAACKQWLIDHFGPAVREAFIAFVHQCQLADYYIRRAYQPVMDLLDNHDPKPFPRPGENPTSPGPAQYPSGTPQQTPVLTTTTTPASATPTTTPAAVTPTTPASVTPTTPQANPLQTVNSLIGQAEQAIQQSVTQLATAAQQGLSRLSPTTPTTDSSVVSASTPDGSKPLANIVLPGGKLALAQTANGSITATVTGPDGKTQQYTLGIKNGVPFLTPDSEAPEDATTSTRSSDSSAPVAAARSSPDIGSPPTSVTPLIMDTGVPVQQHPTSTVPAGSIGPAYDPQTVAGTTATATPMGGMPMGAAGGAKGAADNEHRPRVTALPQPLWNSTPGSSDEHVIDAPAGLDRSIGSAPTSDTQTADQPIDGSTPLPVQPMTAPTVGTRNDGVRIAIDMGEQR